MKIQIRVLLSLMGVALLAASLYNELTALAAGTIRGVSLAGLSIAILALVLGGCVGLYFTRASAQLAQAAAQFAGGDTDLALPAQRADETGVLTELKRAESAVRKLSRAVEQCPVSIVITDTRGAIEYVNPKFTELTGYTLSEVLGQNPRMLKSGTTTPEGYGALWAAITAGLDWHGEFCNRKKNGDLYWEAVVISPIKDDRGNVTHYIAVKEDITGRKQTEAAPVSSGLRGMRVLNLSTCHARILVVEDNITNQQVAVGILKKLGFRPTVAANGAEAVKTLETFPCDLVLMDVQMPEMDGLQATRVIRDPLSRVLNHRIPIVAMTAHAMRGDRQRCLEAGMDDYVTKPIELPALVAALEKWLKPHGEGNQPAAAEVKEKTGALNRAEKFPIFDRAALMGQVMGDEAFARVVIEGFLGDLPGQIEELKRCLAAGDAYHVEQQAHSIKGASATVGGEALRAVAAAMEQAGKAGDLAMVSARMAELEAQFEALAGAMKNGSRPQPR